ncbi:phospholipid/cholesterol/gamma-HCH transport system substrate-binding protein [Amycolatopsis bartoniae]|uniref:ABC transporter substrate-binding protein n=1 Tax=Amycolatopsis bartoniae TaxID=941986 RepID=A0A8H9MGM1_9PSEU|nr:MCE family protein [Amycolatopsis bartoniae]MBB2937539.1 phospholipid/cholesterol/gamma-HCH transport system substrate-binding protein [Amycolatopsis bartoniae]TVT05944.1 MCE family protein [Amycolatopsis bartoniae]GHF82040.1 ABC transporter substrate-binding protein [Amycolatopsis bartoniae]
MRNIAAPLIKIVLFAVVTVLLTGILGATIANTNFGVTAGYTARFTDASGLHEGDDVRIVGVKVGQVDGISVAEDGDRTLADVHFSISSAYHLPAAVTATVKYRNLVGQRYLALGTTVDGAGQLPEGGTIPPERTQPALNLTVLFNGFKPLFQALDPQQVNQLSYEIIQVFQGEGGTIDSLLTHTASITSAIADKDKVIGQVIDNLNTVLATVNQRGPQLGNLIDQTQQLVTGLAQQRQPIGDALSALGDLTNTTAGLVRDARPSVKEDIAQLGVLSGTLSDSGQLLDELLQKMPGNLEKFTRTLSYGSWYNYYLCDLSGTIGISALNITLPLLPIPGTEMPERCKPS